MKVAGYFRASEKARVGRRTETVRPRVLGWYQTQQTIGTATTRYKQHNNPKQSVAMEGSTWVEKKKGKKKKERKQRHKEKNLKNLKKKGAYRARSRTYRAFKVPAPYGVVAVYYHSSMAPSGSGVPNVYSEIRVRRVAIGAVKSQRAINAARASGKAIVHEVQMGLIFQVSHMGDHIAPNGAIEGQFHGSRQSIGR